MTRRFARRFNNLYGLEYFKEPVAYNFGEELVKIPGLTVAGRWEVGRERHLPE